MEQKVQININKFAAYLIKRTNNPKLASYIDDALNQQGISCKQIPTFKDELKAKYEYVIKTAKGYDYNDLTDFERVLLYYVLDNNFQENGDVIPNVWVQENSKHILYAAIQEINKSK